jgi:hypothetical protein
VTLKTLACIAALALVACSKPDAPADTAASSAPPEVSGAAPSEASGTTPPAVGDICALVANPEATFGQPVTSGTATGVTGTTCEWKSADGRLCGVLNVFGPGYNPMPDARTQYAGMATSLKAFGQVQDVSGIGEEAKAVDGGMLGAQLAFRTSEHAVLAASGCSSGADKAPALAEKLAREVAPKL